MDVAMGLKLLKGVFEKKKIKSIILFADEKGEIQFEEFTENVLEQFKDVLTNVSEARDYLASKRVG